MIFYELHQDDYPKSFGQCFDAQSGVLCVRHLALQKDLRFYSKSSSKSAQSSSQYTGGATAGGSTGTTGNSNSIGNTDTRVQTSSNTNANTNANTSLNANGGSTISYTTNNSGITPQDLALFGTIAAKNSNPLGSSSGGGVSAGGVTVMNPANPAVTAITTAAASVRWYVWAGLAVAGLLALKLFSNKKAK